MARMSEQIQHVRTGKQSLLGFQPRERNVKAGKTIKAWSNRACLLAKEQYDTHIRRKDSSSGTQTRHTGWELKHHLEMLLAVSNRKTANSGLNLKSMYCLSSPRVLSGAQQGHRDFRFSPSFPSPFPSILVCFLPLDFLPNGHKMVATAISIISSNNCSSKAESRGKYFSEEFSSCLIGQSCVIWLPTSPCSIWVCTSAVWGKQRKKRNSYKITSQQYLPQCGREAAVWWDILGPRVSPPSIPDTGVGQPDKFQTPIS